MYANVKSLGSTPETKIILYVNYILINFFLKGRDWRFQKRNSMHREAEESEHFS